MSSGSNAILFAPPATESRLKPGHLDSEWPAEFPAPQGNRCAPMPSARAASYETGGTAGVACAACPHAQDSHDAIARRYCTATVAGGFNRRCVCAGGNGEQIKEKS